jgi:hypothetical protein
MSQEEWDKEMERRPRITADRRRRRVAASNAAKAAASAEACLSLGGGLNNILSSPSLPAADLADGGGLNNIITLRLGLQRRRCVQVPVDEDVLPQRSRLLLQLGWPPLLHRR